MKAQTFFLCFKILFCFKIFFALLIQKFYLCQRAGVRVREPRGDDRLRSWQDLEHRGRQGQQRRPPQPLRPRTTSVQVNSENVQTDRGQCVLLEIKLPTRLQRYKLKLFRSTKRKFHKLFNVPQVPINYLNTS